MPFSSSRKRMSCIVEIEGKFYIYSKGAPDLLLPECAKYLGKGGEIKTVDEDYKNVLTYQLYYFSATT